MVSLRQLIALTGLTALEAIRQPICLILTLSCVILTGVMPMVLLHQFTESGKLARDGGLAFQFVIGLFVAGVAASSALSREMREGTAATVLSKPVPRPVFLFSKFLGLVIVIAGFTLCAATATLMAGRVAEQWVAGSGYVIDWRAGKLLLGAPALALILAGLLNFVRRTSFSSTAFLLLMLSLLGALLLSGSYDRTGTPAAFDLRVDWRILAASFMVGLALVAVAALALSLSTRLSTVPTLTICVIMFVGGLMSDTLLGGKLDASFLAAVAYAVIPNWMSFWYADALTGGGIVSAPYLLQSTLYALLYTGAVLLLGMLSFRDVDL